MGIAATGNWLFSTAHLTRSPPPISKSVSLTILDFALGLFVPPAFKNISWKTFMIFGALCLGAAVQFFISYPETGRKSLEEVEEMFRDGGPKPWHTKLGQSYLDDRTASVAAEQRKSSLEDGDKAHVVRTDGTIDTVEKGETEKAENGGEV